METNIFEIFSDSITVNTLGLVFDIIGAILLWKFGLPQNISRSGSSNLILEQVDETEKSKAVIYDRWGQVGIISLIFGFILQAVSNFL